ncbi:nucleic-acid-binding protein from transposon X-element [Trichonephila clavipes]|nr:nucleic-acid-binding protein from transposon X-element [Trichonephila clavipes]
MDVTPPKPKVKPIMMRINKNYNLILQEIYRTYPETVNKNTGNYFKVQLASEEDHENIKKLLNTKKADHYVIEESKIIKTVIKGLPASTDIADIESELKEKGIAAEKVTQLRRFATKAPLPLFMVEVKRSAGAEKIYELKNLNCLTVEVVPYRKRPGTSQCFNCNYFNHTAKNCMMAPRCGQNHRTQSCTKTDRPPSHRISCNADGHMATSRQCSKFPKQKPKKGENPNNNTNINHRPVTTNVSFASVCSKGTKNQMAPREETPQTSNQIPNEKEKNPDNAESNFKFEKFAIYINELQNITSKFPEIFRALEDMSKTNNDVTQHLLTSHCTMVQRHKIKNNHILIHIVIQYHNYSPDS